MFYHNRLFIFLILFCTSYSYQNNPDILLVLVDDMGYADWDNFNTPTIKNIIDNGIVFSRMYHPESMCTPNRAAIVTGRYPIRYGMSNGLIPFRVITSPYHPSGLPLSEKTIATRLKQQNKNYENNVHLIGKWHLGIGENCTYCPTNHGFNTYFGMPLTNIAICGNDDIFDNSHYPFKQFLFASTQYIDNNLIITPLRIIIIYLCIALISSLKYKNNILLIMWLITLISYIYYTNTYFLFNKDNCLLYEGTKIIERPVHLNTLTYRYTQRINNIINSTPLNEPLFIMYAPDKVHTALAVHPNFVNHSGKSLFGDSVEELDASIGEILNTLSKRSKDSIVIILSDNGPHREEGINGGSSGLLRGGKGQAYEGGIRTKAFMLWNKNGQIIKKEINNPVSTMDILPTILDIVNKNNENNIFKKFDGHSLLPLIFPENNQCYVQKPLFHYCGTSIHAMTYLDYKIHFEVAIVDDPINEMCLKSKICPCYGKKYDPPVIFNITDDINENKPIKINFDEFILMRREHEKGISYHENVLHALARPYIKL